MKNVPLRLRYLASYLVLLMPILVFSFVLYYSTMDRGIQYTNTLSMQRFTYAAENISAIVSRLDYAAHSATVLEQQVIQTENSRITLRNEESIPGILSAMEQQISPDVSLLFYVRGDDCLYTTEGKLNYSKWESQYVNEFNLPMSQLFYHLMTFQQSTLLPLQSAANRKNLVGLAYLVPFPTNTEKPSAVLIYMLHSSILEDEFQNYLGEIPGDLYIYDERYRELYTRPAGEEMIMRFEDMVKSRGVGLKKIAYGKQDLVLLRVSDSAQGLHCVMVVPWHVFYADNLSTQRIMLMLIAATILVICLLALWAAFFNYKPINELMMHVTGRRKRRVSRENELEIIKNYYDQSIGEAEELSSHLSELTPIVAQQFVNKLISGKITDREEFSRLSRSADIPFLRSWTAALYVLAPFSAALPAGEDDAILERCSLVVSRFHPAQCTVTYGELSEENALCVLVNFSAENGQEQKESLEIARQLSNQFKDAGIPQVRIGVGQAYQDPLQMPESFAEASVTVQMAPPGRESIFTYSPHAARREEEQGVAQTFSGISSVSLTLLTEGIHRGEKTVAFRALHDIIQEITAVTDSFVYFRFYCAELISVMIRQATDLGIPLKQKYRDSLIDYKSQAEFMEKSSALLEYLCDEVRARLQAEDDQIKRRVMDYILENYKRFDLSIQAVSDDLNIRKSQITALLKEDTGQNFVQYISYLRMNEFKRLLLETDRTIQECVSEIGYSDVPNFLRKFKSIEGCTPGQYRARHRQQEG